MVRSLHSFYPDPEKVLALQPAEMGQDILHKLLNSKDVKKFHRDNFTRDAIRDYPTTYHERIANVLMEGLTWLERHQLVAQSPEANGWYFVTRNGALEKETADKPLESTREPTDERAAQQGVSPVVSTTSDARQNRDETIFRSGISDQAAAKDSLGFGPYVSAIANFLTDDRTEPPLTLSIEGEWGTGKSSFMLQLRALLEKRGNLTVGFNAWRHDKADELWAAFALDFLDQISKKQPLWRRWWANINLKRSRYDWAAGSLDFLRTLATWVLLVLAGGVVPALLIFKGLSWTSEMANSIVQIIGESGDAWTGFVNWLLKIGGTSTIVFLAATLWLKLKRFIGNPITVDLRKHLKSPNYEERVAFVERFHRDLQKVVKCYVGRRKVYVFIDDLDRCEVPKAADLMQAINLMIANDPRLFFIVGMDRQKIAAGLAVKYEKLLPYLAAPRSSPTSQQPISDTEDQSHNDLQPATGLDFGYQFIEKFVQLPFTLPIPSASDLERLLNSVELERERTSSSMERLRNASKARFLRSLDHAKLEDMGDDIFRVEQSRARERNHQTLPPRRQLLNLTGGVNETATIRSILRMVAPILGYNPRRLKQFVNLFRLRAHLAWETGLFDTVLGLRAEETLTLEQLGKFVALSQMYPRLLFDLDNDRQLLKKLEYRAKKLGLPHENDFTEAVRRWEQQTEVLDLLSYGLEDPSSLTATRYSVEWLNVDKLMQIAPYVPRQYADLTIIKSETTGRTVGRPERKDVLVVIEYDESISKFINEYFSRAGFNVVLVEYGPTVVVDVFSKSPNVIVLGDNPKMDSLVVCRQLRENAPGIPVLMLTAKDDIADKVAGLEAGAVDYITKPFSLRELEARIKIALR